MARTGARVRGLLVCAVAFSVAFLPGKSNAAPLDSRGEIKLGVRTYVNARVGVQATDSSYDSVGDVVRSLPVGDPNRTALAALDQTLGFRKSRTFPYSPAGHLRQNRFFAEVELKHDLSRLQKEGFGPLTLLNRLPFRVRNLSYQLTFRGEYDGLYDWGPSEFRTARQWVPCGSVHSTDNNARGCLSSNPATGAFVDVDTKRQELRDNASSRFRLFQASIDADLGSRIWIRFGRQILSWGETDAFRLLDNINPIDSSFGGFLIPLDERRVPLDMLRVQYRIGDLGPAYDTFIELYGAVDSAIGYDPGTPGGSPWSFPNTGVPGATTQSIITPPARTFDDTRGGGRFVFNIGDGTFSLAHYYTYFDVPSVQTFILPTFPVDVTAGSPTGPLNAFEGRYSVRAYQKKQQVQVSGGSMTFALPSLYSILRSEVAYFKDEPRFSQSGLDPFIYHYFDQTGGGFNRIPPSALNNACRRLTNDLASDQEAMDAIQRNAPPKGNDICRLTGGTRRGDSLNMAFGMDVNQFIRVLNPSQTFFISTQFFYKHLFGAVDRVAIPGRIPQEGEVLPVTEADFIVNQGGLSAFGAVEPSLIKQPTDTFLHTLFISTAYRSGTINPAFIFFYDWGGALVYQPSVTFIYDPFRFSIDYSILQAGTLKAGSGVSLLRDRDNIAFRFEYVI